MSERSRSVAVDTEDGIRVVLACNGGATSAPMTPEQACELAAELALAALLSTPDEVNRAALQEGFRAHLLDLAKAAESVAAEREGARVLGVEAAATLERP